ncbi:MAG: hypothetical protein ACM3ST_03405 [Bdellovibrio bacteriovorus]
MHIRSDPYRHWTLLGCVLALSGCAGPATQPPARSDSLGAPVRLESPRLSVTLSGVLGPGDPEGPVKDQGWCEYLLEIRNRGKQPLTIRNVKLLTRSGRYVDSAATYEEITAPPEAGQAFAGSLAKTVAGQVAGHAVPYGGSIFSILVSAASSSDASTHAQAKQAFAVRRLKNVELAPNGVVEGSAFLPDIADRQALVIDYGTGEATDRLELPLTP